VVEVYAANVVVREHVAEKLRLLGLEQGGVVGLVNVVQ
jgi:hypothetical protein